MPVPEVADEPRFHRLLVVALEPAAAADGEGAVDEVEVLGERGLAPDEREDLAHAVDGVVAKRTVLPHERQDGVVVDGERGVTVRGLDGVRFELLGRRVGMGDVQAVPPEPVAAHHDADAVAEELADGDFHLERRLLGVVLKEAGAQCVVAQGVRSSSSASMASPSSSSSRMVMSPRSTRGLSSSCSP